VSTTASTSSPAFINSCAERRCWLQLISETCINPSTPGGASSTESVVKKADAAGDTNIADITVAGGKNTNDPDAQYEVNVSRNAVKDAAREAVTVNTTNTTNNPITVTPVQDETNHNTTYQVTFDGDKAAKQIPLTYKANGSNDQKVTLDKGLNFTNGSNTTASVAADGVVKYDLNNNVNLTPSGSLTIGDTVVNDGGLTINNGPSITKGGINAGNLNITNVKAGVNDNDAVNVKQLKDSRTVVTSNDKSVTVNKTENGNQVTYDLHVAPGAAQSVWNVKSTGNTTADSEAAAKTITDGKTVEMAAGKNLTVKQTSNEDGAKVEYGLAGDLTNIKTIKNEGPATFTIGGNEFKFDGGNVNMGGNNITNLKSGGDVIDNAANIGDVTRISKANDLHIAPTKSDRAGETTTSYSYDAADKSVTLKYNDGNGANQAGTIAKIDLSGLADQIKDGYSFSTDAKGNVVGNHAVTAVGNGKTVSYAAGDNLTITQNIDNATGEQTYTYALSNDIKVGNDVVILSTFNRNNDDINYIFDKVRQCKITYIMSWFPIDNIEISTIIPKEVKDSIYMLEKALYKNVRSTVLANEEQFKAAVNGNLFWEGFSSFSHFY